MRIPDRHGDIDRLMGVHPEFFGRKEDLRRSLHVRILAGHHLESIFEHGFRIQLFADGPAPSDRLFNAFQQDFPAVFLGEVLTAEVTHQKGGHPGSMRTGHGGSAPETVIPAGVHVQGHRAPDTAF